MAEARFSGEPTAVWLTEDDGDRDMRLTEDFWFDDRNEKRWTAPAGSVVDGATIPRPLWALVGSPYTGDYRRASIVHDIACVEAEGDRAARRAADKMFFEGCRTGGCSRREAIILYIGVRIGAWWGSALIQSDAEIRIHESRVDEQVRRDFQDLAEEVLKQGETDDPDEVERRVDAAVDRLQAKFVAYDAARMVHD